MWGIGSTLVVTDGAGRNKDLLGSEGSEAEHLLGGAAFGEEARPKVGGALGGAGQGGGVR